MAIRIYLFQRDVGGSKKVFFRVKTHAGFSH